MSATYNRPSGILGLNDIQSETVRHLLGTRCLGSPGLAIGSSSKAAVKIANTTPYLIDGVFYSKTTAEIAFTDTTVQADGTTKYYLLSLNSSGTGVITSGTSTDLPAAPSGYCPIGYVKIVTSGGAFTPGTTELDNAAVTDTYVNISCIPTTLS